MPTAHAKITKKSKAHTIYKNSDGKRVPGVTTILGILDKPALVKWANNLGLKGIDSNDYVDEMKDIGTLCHGMVEADLKGKDMDTSNYSQNQIDLAENGFLKFLEWRRRNRLKVIASELEVVSEQVQVGGKLDLYAEIHGLKVVVDFKTCKGLYPEHFTQATAYAKILEETGKSVEEIRILRIGRDETEGFEEQIVNKVEERWTMFRHCRKIYELNKTLRNN